MNRWRIGIVLGFIVLFVGAGIVLRWVSPDIQTKPVEVAVAVNSLAVASGPVFVAVDKGMARELGVRIEEAPFAAGRLALDALLGGQVDVATAAETPILLASKNRDDLRVIMTIAESRYRIVARRSSGITTPKDLEGKKIGTFVGTAAEFFLARMLDREGIERPQVTVVSLQPADMVIAIRKKDVDAISVWEPHAHRAMELLGEDAVVFEGSDLYIEYFNLVTTEAVLKNKRDTIEKMAKAIREASLWIQTHEKEATQLIADRIGMNRNELANMWDRFEFPGNLSEDRLLRLLASVEEWAAKNENRPARNRVPLSNLLDSSVILELEREATTPAP